MQEELISIIIPAYKDAYNLDRCIETAISQTYENIEVLLVNNVRNKEIHSICEKWAKRDIRIKLIDKDNDNLASAKNAGLDYANGTFVVFIESEDFVHKEFISSLLKNLKETHSDMSICNFRRIYEDEDEDIDNYEEEEEAIEEPTKDSEEEVIEEESQDSSEGQSDDEEYNYNYESLNEDEENSSNKSISRIVIYEGEDVIDFFFNHYFSSKTSIYGKLFKKKIFKNLRFDESTNYEDDFIIHKIFLNCPKFVSSSAQHYFYTKNKFKINSKIEFTLKDLDSYYAVESRNKYFEKTEWKQKSISQFLREISKIYCIAKTKNADKNTLLFLKHKFKLYYKQSKNKKMRDRLFRRCPTIYFYLNKITPKKY